MTTLEKLRGVFEREFNTNLADFSLETSPYTLREWNSMAHFALILGIEKEFGLQFSTEELGMLEDVAAIHRMIEAKTIGEQAGSARH